MVVPFQNDGGFQRLQLIIEFTFNRWEEIHDILFFNDFLDVLF